MSPSPLKDFQAERARLEKVIEGAKQAKLRIAVLDRLIVLYGNDDEVDEKPGSYFKCPHCAKTSPSEQGLKSHITRSHKGES
jgi:hypothetical protein